MVCTTTNITECEHACPFIGYCSAKLFQILREEDLKRAEIVRAVRKTIFGVTQAEGVTPSRTRAWLYDKLWQIKVQPVNQNHKPVDFDTDCFEPTDEDIDKDVVPVFEERLREFFRTNAHSEPNQGRVFVTSRWHTQFMSMATIVGSYRPDESQWWPRVINGEYVDPKVANLNRPPVRR